MRLEVKKATEAEPEPVMTLELVGSGEQVVLYASLSGGSRYSVLALRMDEGKVYGARQRVPAKYFQTTTQGWIQFSSEDHAS